MPNDFIIIHIIANHNDKNGIGYCDRMGVRAYYAALARNKRVESAHDLEQYENACPCGLPAARMLRDAYMHLA